MKKHSAFTLAETLMTLMIIGVIASMTIPSLIKSTHQKETVAGVKKAYSTFCNAYDLVVQNYGPPTVWGWSGDDGNEKVLKMFSEYMNVDKFCGKATGCYPDTMVKLITGADYQNYERAPARAKLRLADGTLVHTLSTDPTCKTSMGTTDSLKHVCGEIQIDTNGYKGPNQYGVDMFMFWVTIDSVVPAGVKEDTNYDLISHCVNGYGWGCAGWVLTNENLDYLSKNVSW